MKLCICVAKYKNALLQLETRKKKFHFKQNTIFFLREN